eukprot:1299331-Prymnesium_polylepis.1
MESRQAATPSGWGTLLLETYSTHGVHPLARDQPEVLKLKGGEVIIGRNVQCNWRLSKALTWVSNKHLALGCAGRADCTAASRAGQRFARRGPHLSCCPPAKPFLHGDCCVTFFSAPPTGAMRCVSRTWRTSRATGRGSTARGCSRARRRASRPAARPWALPCFGTPRLARCPLGLPLGRCPLGLAPARARSPPIVCVWCSQRALRDDDSIELQADEADKHSSITFRFVAPPQNTAADPLTSTRRKS